MTRQIVSMIQNKNLLSALTTYLDKYCVLQQNMSENHIRNKRALIKDLLLFLDDQPYTLDTVLQFRLHMHARYKTPASRDDLTAQLRAITNWLYNNKYLKENFSRQITRQQVPKRRIYYIEPEKLVAVIIAGTEPKPIVWRQAGDNKRTRKIKQETRLALFFMQLTGFRIGEITSLKVEDLDFDQEKPVCYVHTEKTQDIDEYPIPLNLVEAIRKHCRGRRPTDRVFQVTKETCNTALQRGAKAVGIDKQLTNHDIRRIFGTHLTKQNTSAPLLKKAMRHKNIGTTMRYYVDLDTTDLVNLINSQQLVQSSLPTTEKLSKVEEKLIKMGNELEKDPMIDVTWKKENGKLTFEFVPRTTPKTQGAVLSPLERAISQM